MKEYVVEIPFVGYVSVIVEAQNKAKALEEALEVVEATEFKTDGQNRTLEIEEILTIDDTDNFDSGNMLQPISVKVVGK